MFHVLELYQVTGNLKHGVGIYNKLRDLREEFLRVTGGMTTSKSAHEGLYENEAGDVVRDEVYIAEVIFDGVVRPEINELLDEWSKLNFEAGQESVLYKLDGYPIFRYAEDEKSETPADDEAETPLFSPWPPDENLDLVIGRDEPRNS